MSLRSRVREMFLYDEGNYTTPEQTEGTAAQKPAVKDAPAPQASATPRSNRKMVSLNQLRQDDNKQIALAKPRVFSDAKGIAKQILAHQAVVVNFNNTNDVAAKRIVDFLSGTVYAVDGEIQRVGERIFLCTPADFKVEGATSIDQTEF